VAERLARWALVNDYGQKLPYRSPELKDAKFDGGKALLTFDYAPSGLRTVDIDEPQGFAICGEDKKWVWAKASIIGGSKHGTNQIEVSSPAVTKPVAVRYAWADNPVCNVYSFDGGLPLTPFRTDDFPMITDPANPNSAEAQNAKRAEELKKLMESEEEGRGRRRSDFPSAGQLFHQQTCVRSGGTRMFVASRHLHEHPTAPDSPRLAVLPHSRRRNPQRNRPTATQAIDVGSGAWDGIVNIDVSVLFPDYREPWNAGQPSGGSGTGFLIGKNRFLTNAHVVSNATRILIRTTQRPGAASGQDRPHRA
jgi:hypothetical protein